MKHLQKKYRPKDINQRAKLVVDIAIGEVMEPLGNFKDTKAIILSKIWSLVR